MSGANASLIGRSNQVMPGANASPIGRSHVTRTFFDKVFWARYSPPQRGGVDATSRRYREASFEERTGWSLTSHISECVLNRACKRPPRPRRFGGFATFSYWRSHPSSGRRGVSRPNHFGRPVFLPPPHSSPFQIRKAG